MCSEFATTEKEIRQQKSASQTTSRAALVNGPNPALCEASSSSGLCNVTEQILNNQH